MITAVLTRIAFVFVIVFTFYKSYHVYSNMYSQFFFGDTDHVNDQKFYTRSGAFARPLPSKHLSDYVLETPEEVGHDHERKRQKIEKSNTSRIKRKP